MTGTVELAWGVRASFLAYIEALRDGSVSVADGAQRDADGFRLPGRRLDAGEYAFEGSLHFFGYAGALDVTLRDLRVHVDGDSGALTAAVAGLRIPLAAIAGPRSDAGGTTVFSEVTFTDDGAALLGGVYSAGTPSDPVTIRVMD